MKNIFKTSVLSLSLLALSSCNSVAPDIFDPKNHDLIDRAHNLTRQDYRHILDPEQIHKTEGTTDGDYADFKTQVSTGEPSGAPPIPELAPILALPEPPQIGETKLVSIAVTDDVPLKDVLLELARLAEVDIEVDAGITGGIAFRAKDKPFNEVIERISDLAGLRYNMEKGVLRVERDTPYIEIYTLDFLNMERSTNSTVSISTNVLSGGGSDSSSGSTSGTTSGSTSGSSGSSGNSGLNTGSQSTITSSTPSDFWENFKKSVEEILKFADAARSAETTVPEQVVTSTTTSTSAASADPAAPTAAAAAPEPAAASSTTTTTTTTSTTGTNSTFYVLNQQGATLTVSGTQKHHKMIKRFLSTLERNASAQVLIEAKIVEVALDQEFASGIDWTNLGGTDFNLGGTQFGSVADQGNVATLSFMSNDLTGLNIDLNAAVQLAERFGTTRTLSSPRLHAINNQQSVLTFAENQVYFQLTIDQQTTSGSTNPVTDLTVNSEIKTVPIGIILTLQPVINLETNEVTLSVRPTLSRVTGSVSDPAVAFLVAQTAGATNIESKIPIVEVRELDSILKLKSGQVMVIGGLMEDKSINEDSGIPGLQEVPVVGNLFKGISRDNETKELVIFIRATILDSHGNVQDADKNLYQKFIRDPRPMTF